MQPLFISLAVFLTAFFKINFDKNNESFMDAKLFKDYIKISFIKNTGELILLIFLRFLSPLNRSCHRKHLRVHRR